MNILWVDDEIDLLKPYTIFLADKGYDVETASNGQDAIDMCRENMYDIVFLDENMPGLSGLETLARISEMRPNLPVVMITKSEEVRSILSSMVLTRRAEGDVPGAYPERAWQCRRWRKFATIRRSAMGKR